MPNPQDSKITTAEIRQARFPGKCVRALLDISLCMTRVPTRSAGGAQKSLYGASGLYLHFSSPLSS